MKRAEVVSFLLSVIVSLFSMFATIIAKQFLIVTFAGENFYLKRRPDYLKIEVF
jgi:hypothetical protein